MRDKLIRIKRSRYKPEELFLIDLIDGMSIREQSIYNDRVYWEKDGKLVFKAGWDLVNENKEILPESEEFTKAVEDLMKARTFILETLDKYR